MAGKNVATSGKGPMVDLDTSQPLSPKSTTNRLLLMEDSLGEVWSSIHNIHELVGNLGRQLELISIKQERLRLDLGNRNNEEHGDQCQDRPRNRLRTPETARNVGGHERRHQDLQLCIQDSDFSDDEGDFVQEWEVQEQEFNRQESLLRCLDQEFHKNCQDELMERENLLLASDFFQEKLSQISSINIEDEFLLSFSDYFDEGDEILFCLEKLFTNTVACDKDPKEEHVAKVEKGLVGADIIEVGKTGESSIYQPQEFKSNLLHEGHAVIELRLISLKNQDLASKELGSLQILYDYRK